MIMKVLTGCLLVIYQLLAAKANAQESRWLLGTGITYCSYIDSPGLNLNVTYRVVGNLHIGPDFSALLTREVLENGKTVKKKELEYNFNASYLFEVKKSISLYPLLGINLSEITLHPEGEEANKRLVTALNIGGGIEYQLKKFRLFLEPKYVTELSKLDIATGILFEL